MIRITLVEGDLTEQAVDAIVNAANNDLLLGSGVAGAIARRGGPRIAQECAAHGPIAVGEAAVTGGGDLPARYVIHAAGMALGGRATEESVGSALRASLDHAARLGIRSVAVPAIGAGVGGLGLQRCAEISIACARQFAEEQGEGAVLEEIRFVLMGEPAFRLFEMVNDAAKVEAQMRRMARRGRGGEG
ncbi:MAG: macro domain-containing protein [Myxococcota bacterium]